MCPKRPEESGDRRLTRLPEANEFSPGQIDLPEFLVVVTKAKGDRDRVVEAVRGRFFADAASSRVDPDERLQQQRTRAYNAVLGASKYGLVTDDLAGLTSLGIEALDAGDDELYRLLARHIIRDLGGFEVLVAVKEMQAAGIEVNKSSLQEYLERFAGLELPRATTHHMKLLQWLRKAGVLPDRGYVVSDSAIREIADLSIDDAETWVALTPEQTAFLRVLRRMTLVEGEDHIPAKAVIDAVETEYGPIFERKDQLAASVLKPLASPESGWITHTISSSGRGGKSGFVSATPKLLEVEVDLLPEGDGLGIPADLKSKLRTSIDQVYEDLKSPDTYVKGVALELLALRMALDLTLVPIRLRERGSTTGGAEVDLIAEGAHLHFSRWLLQCKNTGSVGVGALAKEVGMAVLLKAHVVVMVTTGKFSASVHSYANELAASGSLQAVLVDGTTLDSYRRSGPKALRGFFHDWAGETLTLKRPQVVIDAGS
jgi:Restriction endonuclease